MSHTYSEQFRRKIVQRSFAPGSPGVIALAKEAGIGRTTLSRWRNEAQLDPLTSEHLVSKPKKKKKDRPSQRSAQDMLRRVFEFDALSEHERGAWLRTQAVTQPQIDQWRQHVLDALEPDPLAPRRAADDKRRIEALERELRRKEKALAEAAALLVLQKKARALWEGADDDTDSTSEY